MIYKGFLSFLLIFLLFGLLRAQDTNLKYTQNFTIADGLSHNGVTSILKDSEGYFWIGTYDGLARYDGYEFKVFKNTPNRELIASNRIRAIEEDNQGNLWLGTDEGISIYNFAREEFKNIFSNKGEGAKTKGPIVRKIIIKEDNSAICITQNDGILFFDESFGLYEQCKLPDDLREERISLYNAIKLDSLNLVLATSQGLIHFNETEKSYNWIRRVTTNFESSVCKYKDQTLLATFFSGIAIINYRKIAGKYYFFYDTTRVDSQQFSSLTVDHQQNLWVGRFNNGLLKIEGVEAFIKGEPYRSLSFGENGLYRTSSIITTEHYGCWVGTFNKGIFQFNLNQNPFRTYDLDSEEAVDIRSSRVEMLCPFDEERVLIKLQNADIYSFNTRTGTFENTPEYLSRVTITGISKILIDSNGNTWITHCNSEDLIRIRKDKKTIDTIDFGDNASPFFGVLRSIVEDKEGNIWVADIDEAYRIRVGKKGDILGVEFLNDHEFFQDLPLSLLRVLYPDPLNNVIWIGTEKDGLLRIKYEGDEKLKDFKIEQFIRDVDNPKSLPSNFVSSFVRLPNNQFWIGTEGGGICKVENSITTPEFTSYAEKEGLSNNVVKSIVADKDNSLWISTNIGLNKFDIGSSQFRSFRKEDGLPFEDYYYTSAKLNGGMLLFAGLTDFCYFLPGSIPDKEPLPGLRFRNFKIFNRVVTTGDTINNRVLLEKSIAETEEISLKHKENFFSIEFLSLHYSNPENHYLRYQLLPINEEWIKIPSSQRILNYNGLQPGEYELRVMASNSVNEWTEPKSLKIVINPPFWVTKEAFILYVLFLGMIIYSIMYYILRMNRLRHNLEIEHLEKENVKEVNAAKLRFFSNISHEIKTPLTLITGPLSLMTERYSGNTDLTDKLQIIQRQSKKISQLVDQVHDFQKADANKLKMNYSNFCFNNFISELIKDFKFLAANDKKNLEIKNDGELIYVSADNDKLEKIINNLLSNALKYTKEGDTITVEYKLIENDLFLSVKDTGRGIAAEDLPHIFERFYQSQSGHNEYVGGSGIGLAFTKRLVEMHLGFISAESILHEGTTITVRLPIIIKQPQDDLTEKESQILEAEKTFNNSDLVRETIDFTKIEVDGNFADAKIFIAEDNSEMRKFIKAVLAKYFNVTAFTNGKELIDAIAEEWPDIVVSDVLMPEMNGFDLCKQIKADIKTSHIPVILLTACTSIDEQLKGLKFGADAYIRKPFSIQYLITRIETLLQNRKQLRERFKINFPVVLEKKKENDRDISFLEKLYAIMEENLDNGDFEIDELARQLYFNRSQFFQKVKSLTNETPYELLKAYRLKRAAELLVQKQLSVKEVYLITGFKSRSHFSKLFKEKYGITPGNYASEILSK